MTYDEQQHDFEDGSPDEAGHVDDGRTSLALALGIAAALAAGGLWAAIVYFTNYELGYAAWGVGLIVGVAMSRATSNRTTALANAAAALALTGLLAGKVIIFASSGGRLAEEIGRSDDTMTGAVAWQLYESRSLDEATLAELDSTLAAGDTLSDAVWESMQSQAAARLAGMSEAERRAAADAVAGSYLRSMGVFGGVRSQLSLFDLLWVFLAMGTAHRMLAPPKEGVPIEVDQA